MKYLKNYQDGEAISVKFHTQMAQRQGDIICLCLYECISVKSSI